MRKRDEKFLSRSYRRRKASDLSVLPGISPRTSAKLIQKAVRFIKAKQFFYSGFPEIYSHDQRGDIVVSITQDPERRDRFDVNFKFIVLPGGAPLFRKLKIISLTELKRLANEYDKHKEQIDEELSRREDMLDK